MSEEITVGAELSWSQSGSLETVSLRGIKLDMSGNQFAHVRQTIGTSEETTLLTGDIAAGGYVLCINRDATNYIELRPNTGVADMIKLNPGEIALFRLAADAVPYAIANTSSCDLEFWCLDA